MNQEMLENLVSLNGKRKLKLENHMLVSEDGEETYSVVEETPILLPKNQVADIDMEPCKEILKLGIPNTFYEQIIKDRNRTNDYEAYEKEFREYVKQHLGKNGILATYKKYALLDVKKKDLWISNQYLTEDSNSTYDDRFGQIPMQAYSSYLTYTAVQNGRERMETYQKMLETWAIHLPEYGYEVNKGERSLIVELGTGAGLGTSSVLCNGFKKNHLITIDIDYACLGNAIGLAMYLNLQNQVSTLCANFWNLPIQSSSISTVCTHYGLDEARKIPRIISEIARILKVGGKLVVVTRVDHYFFLRRVFEECQFTGQEYQQLVEDGELNPGVGEMIRIASSHGLILKERKNFVLGHSHERVLLVFEKEGIQK